MAWLGSLPSDMDALLQCAMEIGQMNFKVMGILDDSATDTYGHPIPTQINVKPIMRTLMAFYRSLSTNNNFIDFL